MVFNESFSNDKETANGNEPKEEKRVLTLPKFFFLGSIFELKNRN